MSHLTHRAGPVWCTGPLTAPVLRPPEAQGQTEHVHTVALGPALQPGVAVPVLPAVPPALAAGGLSLAAMVTSPTLHGQ